VPQEQTCRNARPSVPPSAFWHLADTDLHAFMSAFRCRADIPDVIANVRAQVLCGGTLDARKHNDHMARLSVPLFAKSLILLNWRTPPLGTI
jgi:hypothetical protein